MKFELTEKQREAREYLSGDAQNVMLFGGSRSGKTFLTVRQMVVRALKAPKSRHAILRFRFNHAKASIVLDTFPKVMELCFPGEQYEWDKTDWYAKLPGKSQIWIGGLDDKERAEKILGQEYATIFLNECSQIPWASAQMAATRLAQRAEVKVPGLPADPLLPRMFYDCNPPTKAHWTYRMFVEGRDPETKQPLPNPNDWMCFQINPGDNKRNLPPGYLENTLKNMSARMRRRFLDGEFSDATPNALFAQEDVDKWRVTDGKLPDMVRIVIAVDPSGADDEDNADNDEIGIVAAGLGVDGNAYLLEDATVKAGPGTWGNVATTAFDRHEADVVVGEGNFGGAMVEMVIKTARPRTNFKMVTASRGKAVRAEPFSSLYEQGKCRHVGYFPELEDELAAFSTHGYLGSGSPNRADAWIWALTELFAGITAPKREKKAIVRPYQPAVHGVM